MDFMEERFKRQEVLDKIISQLRVVHHDAHRPQRPLEVPKSQSLPPPRRNGYLVTSEYPEPGREARRYHGDDGRTRMDETSHSRQLSLPSRHPRVEARRDHARSAPSHQVAPAHEAAGVPLPRVNNLMSGLSLYGGDTKQFISKGVAGVPTRYQDESHSKSNKFASRWAQVRAENHIELTASNERESDHVKETPRENTKHSQKQTEKSVSVFYARPREEAEKNKGSEPHPSKADHARSHDNKATEPQPGNTFHARPPEKEKVQPYDSQSQQPQSSQSKNAKERQESTLETSNLNSDLKAEPRDDSFRDDLGDGKKTDANDKGWKLERRKPAWNDRLALNPNALQPPRGSWRQYEAELTYKPATTSTQHIYKAYVSQPRNKKTLDASAATTVAVDDDEDDRRVGDNTTVTPQRPGASTAPDEMPTPEASPRGKEYILSRNEARAYLQMHEAYDSDLLRAARKKRFFKALVEVQVLEQRRQAEEEQRRKKRREESRRRQQRQLLHVRRKFRKEQAYRFRTQYVTLRVFEQDGRGGRQTYGLPNDSDDESFLDDGGRQAGGRDEAENTRSEPNSSAKPASVHSGTRQVEKTSSGKESTHSNSDVMERDVSPHRKVTFPSENATDAKHNELNHSRTSGAQPSGLNAKSPAVDTSFSVSQGTSPGKHTSQEGGAGGKDTAGKVLKNDPSSLNSSVKASVAEEGTKSRENNQGPLAQRGNAGKSESTKERREQGKDRKIGRGAKTKAKSETNEQLTRVDSKKPNPQSDKVSSSETAVPDSKPSKEKDDTSRKMDAEKDQSRKNNIQRVEDHVIKDQTAEATPKRGGSHQGSKTVVPLGVSTASKSSDIQEKASGQKGFEPRAVSTDKTGPSLETKAKGDKTETSAKVLPKASHKDVAHNRVQNSEVTNYPVNSTASSKQETVRSENRQKENIPVVKDSAATKTMTSKRRDGKFVTTRTVNLQKGGVGKNSEKADDKIQISSNDMTVKEKQKRKPSLRHAQSDAEKKRNFEKRYMHMFDTMTGPSQKSRLKTPKMEGIDTVVIRETDKEGHIRNKKREVRDVVREAKQLANAPSESESFDESETPRGQKPATTFTSRNHLLRPASADTLDFDDDDDDDDDDDIFERVRNKYNLQIDSDDEDV